MPVPSAYPCQVMYQDRFSIDTKIKLLNANLFLSQNFSYPAAFFMDIFPFLLISNFLHQQFVASHDNNQNDGLLLWGRQSNAYEYMKPIEYIVMLCYVMSVYVCGVVFEINTNIYFNWFVFQL